MATRWSTRQALVVLLAGGLIVAGSVSFVARYAFGPDCGAERVDSPVSPLQSAETLRQRPQENREKTVAALEAMGAPFGPVVAGADYYYDQFLRLYGVAGGVLAWTKNNAPVTYLDDATLAPRWSLRPEAERTAWDASEDQFVLLNLEDQGPVTIAAFDLKNGYDEWCVEVDLGHRAGEPVATTFLPGGDLIAALPSGPEITVFRFGAKDGEADWSRKVATADRADYLGMLTENLVLVGGSEESRLTDPAAKRTTPSSVTAIDVGTSVPAWTWDDGPDSTLHVVGAAGGSAAVLVRNARGVELVSLSDAGKVQWRSKLSAGGREATLRDGVVVTRADAGLVGYDAATGKQVWRRAIPTDKPYVPLGFSLAQMPSVDAEHLLLPTVSSLELLDVGTGLSQQFKMPVDGLSSAYFPYQLLVTARHLGVVTNTGAVLAERE